MPATLEQETRVEILDTFLQNDRGDQTKLAPLHAQAMSADPYFYAHLAVWYKTNGSVRDHQELFVANLLTTNELPYRDVGYALLQDLPPHQVQRVVDFIKKNSKVRRSTKTAVEHYLRRREADYGWFDGCVGTARKSMKSLYAGLHIKPSERANAILFQDNPPEDSKAAVVKQIAGAESPELQALLITQNKIPYKVAAGAIKQLTPVTLLALLEVMTPAEVINNMASLERKGAFKYPEVKARIDAKLLEAQTDKRVNALKAKVAVTNANVSQDTKTKLDTVADKQLLRKGMIKVPTALFVDRSGSMTPCIELGKRLAAMISGVSKSDLFVYAFNTTPEQVEVASDRAAELSAWEGAFRTIRASGGTSCGCPFALMAAKKQKVEQVMIVTDEDENTQPLFSEAIQQYAKALSIPVPHVTIVSVESIRPELRRSLRAAGIANDVIPVKGNDYYALPNLIPLLAKGSRFDLVVEILSNTLPKRDKV